MRPCHKNIYYNWVALLLYSQAWSRNILNSSNYLKLGEKTHIINANPSNHKRPALKNYTQIFFSLLDTVS